MKEKKISEAHVKNTAKLAMLDFSADEIEKFGSYLAKILLYMENLNELDTEKVKPTSHPLGINARMREDTEHPQNAGVKAVESAPLSADGFFSVPKALED